MKTAIRVLVTFISTVSALYFFFWVGAAVLFGLDVPHGVSVASSVVVAAVVGRYVWLHTASLSGGFIHHVVLGAVTTGGIGFAAGFFGPILFMPGANQGPLLGIFITGPLGFVLGAIGGAVRWLTQTRRASTTSGREAD